MKAEELMRFDWVCLEEDNTPRQVDWIRSGEVGLLWNQTVTPPYLKPIPLTKEILEKNGFTCDSYVINDSDELIVRVKYGEYQRNTDDGFKMFADGKAIKYVHELQHALRLCGIEKNIEL